jgi:hypothetical protein
MGFKPGQSGNPGGRPAGGSNQLTAKLRQIMSKETPAIVRKLCKDARDGDRVAANLVLRFAPRARVIGGFEFAMPSIASAADVPAAILLVLGRMSEGQLTAAEGGALIAGLRAYTEAALGAGHEQRLQEIETRLGLASPVSGNGHWAEQ